MKITIYQNREVYKEESKIGNDSENKVETLEFEFPEEYEDFTKYIEFQIKGEKYVDLIEDNKYVITREVAKYGKIKTQVVLKKNTENDVMVFKSDIFTLTVSNSINATENLVYTVGVDLIEKIVTKNNEQDARLDTLEADNTTNKENISNIQEEQTTQNNRLDSLEVDNTANKSDISNIKQEQITQNTNIQNNTEDIAAINKKDTTQDKLIEELQTKLEEVEAENVSLKNQIPQGEATGNPIHLTDSSDMKCEIVVKGNAEQETSSQGKNYFTGNKIGSGTEKGVEYNFNNSILKLNGTVTANGNIILDRSTKVKLPAGTYTYSIKVNSGTFERPSGDFAVYLMSGSNSFITGSYTTSGITGLDLSKGDRLKSINITLTEETEIYLRIYTSNKNIVFNNLELCIQIESGTSYTEFEQFIPNSPSPDYPSEIVTVGSNVNLCDNSRILVGIDPQNSSEKDFRTSDYIKVEYGKNYVASLYNEKKVRIGNLVYQTWNKNFEKLQQITTNTIKITNQDIAYVTVRNYKNDAEEIKNKFYYKFEESLIATPYSPFGQGSVEIDACNKNLFDKNNINKLVGYVDGNGNFNIGNLNTRTLYISCMANTDYVVSRVSGQYFKIASFSEEIKNNVHMINGITNKPTASKLSINTGDNAKYLAVTYYNSSKDTLTEQEILNSIQIELGSEATDYIPHESYTKVLPIQQEMLEGDYISDKEYHNWEKIDSYNGEEITTDFKSTTGELTTGATVYYKLAEPKGLELTEEQKAVLNSFYTYKNVTNISMSGIGTLKVNYKKDLETIINNLSATSVAE